MAWFNAVDSYLITHCWAICLHATASRCLYHYKQEGCPPFHLSRTISLQSQTGSINPHTRTNFRLEHLWKLEASSPQSLDSSLWCKMSCSRHRFLIVSAWPEHCRFLGKSSGVTWSIQICWQRSPRVFPQRLICWLSVHTLCIVNRHDPIHSCKHLPSCHCCSDRICCGFAFR